VRRATEQLEPRLGRRQPPEQRGGHAVACAAYNAAAPASPRFYTRLGADERLYAKYKTIDAASLNAEQRQPTKNAIRNFVLSGGGLVGEAKRLADIQRARPG
jgi:oligopeptidase A